MRSWSGCWAGSERAALSTPARGGASRAGIVIPVVLGGELAARTLHHLDPRLGVAGPLAPGQQ